MKNIDEIGRANIFWHENSFAFCQIFNIPLFINMAHLKHIADMILAGQSES